MTGARVTAHGAGRTDAGVHARGQVAHVDLERDWSPFRLSEGLNALVQPHPVAVLGAERVSPDFDARHSATARHYLYRVVNRRAPLTFERGCAWRVKPRLDAEAMHAAARVLIGRHDFSTFRDSQCQANSPIRTLDRLDVRREGDDILFEASARSFLHRQVRSMVGTLVEVGAGRWSAGDFKAAFEAADRSRCGPVAPPHGLYLVRVDYAERLSEIKLERALIDARQRFEIVDRDALVDGVNRGVDEAKLDHRTGVLDEARVRSPPAGRERRLPPGHVLDRFGDEIGERSRLGEEGACVAGLEGQRRASASVRRRHPALDLRGERIVRPKVVEADVELEAHFAGNDVERRIADVDRDHFEVRGLEVGVSLIERRREQRRQYGRERQESDCRRYAGKPRGPGGRGS